MAEARRKPGRPLKHVGLTSPGPKKVDDGDPLRDLREEEQVTEEPVLLPARGPDAPKTRSHGIFGSAGRGNLGGGAENFQPAVLDAPRRPGEEVDLSFSALLRRIALEIAPDLHQETDRRMTNMEVLARRVFDSALSSGMGAQKARELVVDRLEGKAGRATPVQGANTELDDQLDRVAIGLLNELVPRSKDTTND